MSSFILIGASDACGGLLPIIRVVFNLLKIVWILVPIGLIVFGTIDLGKAVIEVMRKKLRQLKED